MKVFESFYLDGGWAAPATNAKFDIVAPYSEEWIGQAPEGAASDIDAAVTAARRAFDAGPWPRLEPSERAAVLRKMADYVTARVSDLADTLVAEVGTTLAMNTAASYGAAAVMRYYADLAEEIGVEETRQGARGPATVRHEPAGVVAIIVPWNAPFFLLLLKVAPALAAGCAIVAKPAPETPLSAYVLAQAADAAGLPAGVLNIVAGGRRAGEHLVRHPEIDKVSFTGSTAAGRKIGAICGEHLKRVSLELGGKSAAIVLDDADVKDVLSTVIPHGLAQNNGQACVALSRILLPRSRYSELVDAITDDVRSLKMGDPRDMSVQLGPLISKRQRTRVESYIASGREEGARITTGGARPAELPKGWYVQPTVFADVDNNMRIAREEIFGPVATLMPYEDESDAIRIANDSPYGLAGAVITKDTTRAFEVARSVRTGSFGVNGFGLDFMLPFGGFKASGLGREMGREGFENFREIKTIFAVR